MIFVCHAYVLLTMSLTVHRFQFRIFVACAWCAGLRFFLSVCRAQYSSIHRFETNKLRNVAKFFGHLLYSDGLDWGVLEYIKLTEGDTTSSSRIFLKILFQVCECFALPPVAHLQIVAISLFVFECTCILTMCPGACRVPRSAEVEGSPRGPVRHELNFLASFGSSSLSEFFFDSHVLSIEFYHPPGRMAKRLSASFPRRIPKTHAFQSSFSHSAVWAVSRTFLFLD